MGYTLRLAITELAPGQTQAYLVVNDGFAALEDATNRALTVDLSTDDYTLDPLEVVGYGLYLLDGAAVARYLTIPAQVGANPTDRMMYFKNISTAPVTILSEDENSSVDIPPGVSVGLKVTENELLVYTTAALEDSANHRIYVDLGSGNYTLTSEDVSRNSLFIFDNATVDRTVTIPDTLGDSDINRILYFKNTTTGTVTIQSQDTGSQVVLPPGESIGIKVDGNVLEDFVSARNFTIGAFFPGLNSGSEELLVKYVHTSRVIYPEGFLGAHADAEVFPDVPTRYEIRYNDTPIGEVVVSSSGDSYSSSSGPETFDPGDVLSIWHTPYLAAIVNFNAAADAASSITLDDGVNSPVTFTFGAGGGQVLPGANATASRDNLYAAIIDDGTLNVSVYPEGTADLIIILHHTTDADLSKVDGNNRFTFNPLAIDSVIEDVAITLVGNK